MKRATSLLATTCFLSAVRAGPILVSDDRVRNLDINPMLGRGYSFGTDKFYPACLVVEEASDPSYNYDYYFTDLTNSGEVESQLRGKVSSSFGYSFIKESISDTFTKDFKRKTKDLYHVVMTMRVERYYSSIKEDTAYLSHTAEPLLENRDYVGFFSACGSNYVRGIRRAMEVTSVFTFEAKGESRAKDYAFDLQLKIFGSQDDNRKDESEETRNSTKSLTIKIAAFGLVLDDLGSSTLVATSLKDYKNAMRFAFRSMTKEPASGLLKQSGMISSLELVPWVENTAFQEACGIQDTIIQKPVERSLLPTVMESGKPCADSSQVFDSTGRCCDPNDLVGAKDGVAETGICKPTRPLSNFQMKHNMMTNGEFVAMMDRTWGEKLNALYQLEACLEKVNSIPERFDFQYLKTKDNARYDTELEMNFTVKELKMALDPTEDVGLVKHFAKELDEYKEMFYTACMTALLDSSKSFGTDEPVDQVSFMASPWHEHAECSHLSCLRQNVRWDRGSGGCIPNLMSDTELEEKFYWGANDRQCAKVLMEQVRDDGFMMGAEYCKFSNENLSSFENKAINCWKSMNGLNVPPKILPVNLIEHFCMPELSGIQADNRAQRRIKGREKECRPARSKKSSRMMGKSPSAKRTF